MLAPCRGRKLLPAAVKLLPVLYVSVINIFYSFGTIEPISIILKIYMKVTDEAYLAENRKHDTKDVSSSCECANCS